MGEVFAGRYELVDPVGRGGAGAVWRTWDRRRRRYVAAKVLQQSDAHTLLRFVREQALRIDHPHVLAPASWAADDDKVLFTMDLVGGGSLAHLIGDYGPLPPRFVCVLLDQLLAGLAAVHAEGVVHRDIKPANILLEATGSGRPHLRLSDFGISLRKDEPRLTETNYVVGTPGYFAPEQMMGAEPDFPADLFAVGLVALYLLEGSKPDARALVEYFAAHGTPGAPQGIPEPLWQVLAGLLQPNPQNRFRTATGARKALASAVELLPEQDPDEEPVEVFDQIGPLPPGFTEHGPERAGPAEPEGSPAGAGASAEGGAAGAGASAGGSPAGAGASAEGDLPSASVPFQTSQAAPSQALQGFGPGGLPPAPLQPPTPSTRAPASAANPAPSPVQAPSPSPYAYPYPVQAGPAYPPPPYEQTPPTPATAPYTATSLNAAPPPQVPVQGASFGAFPAHQHQHQHQQQHQSEPQRAAQPGQGPVSGHARRPGPPVQVVVPVLLVALVCFAVGIWALTRV
ncbi:serine/threonine-protein kinase [Streptomyces sp. NPDC048111]|uniref:serine/threonine-protein kinase n=1 Tax=Streptomyces sp. NPDC048111 TaxID=3365500 RepID=UPI003714AE55